MPTMGMDIEMVDLCSEDNFAKDLDGFLQNF